MRVGNFPEKNSLISKMSAVERSSISKALSSMTNDLDALQAVEHILSRLLIEPIKELTPNADEGYVAACTRDMMKDCASRAGDTDIVTAIDKMIADRKAGIPAQTHPQEKAGYTPNPTSQALLEQLDKQPPTSR